MIWKLYFFWLIFHDKPDDNLDAILKESKFSKNANLTWKLNFFSLILHDKPENNLDALFRAFYFKRIKQILKTPIWPKNYTFFHWFYMTSLRIIWMHFFPVEVHFPTWLVPKVWGLARMANQVIISQQMYVHCTFFIHMYALEKN